MPSRYESDLRYAKYYASVAMEAANLYKRDGSGALEALAIFERERGQILGGLGWVSSYFKGERNQALGHLGSASDGDLIRWLLLDYVDTMIIFSRSDYSIRDLIPFLVQAKTAAQHLEFSDLVVRYLYQLGSAYITLGDAQRSIEYCDQALKVRLEPEPRIECLALTVRATAYQQLGYTQQAAQTADKALQAAQRLGDVEILSRATYICGTICASLGSANHAIRYLDESLRYIERLEDNSVKGHPGEVSVLLALAEVHLEFFDIHDAIKYYERIMKLVQSFYDQRGEAAALVGLGNAYLLLGSISRAVECYEKALRIARQCGLLREEARALGSLGDTYSMLGNKRLAIECYRGLLEIALSISDRLTVTEYLCKLGAETMPESYHMIGMKLEDTAEALTAAQKIGSLRLILICEIELGIALAKLQNFEVATNYYNEAMVLANMKRYHRFIGIISYFLGILYHDQGLAHDALSQYQYSLRFFEQDKHVYYQKSILIRIAQIYDVLGDLNNSADFYNKANNIVVDVEDIADEDRSWYTNMSQESRHEYTDIFQVLENSDLAYTRSKGIDVLMGRCAIFLKLGNEAEIGRLNDAIERQHQEEMRRKEIRWKIIWVVIVVFIVGVLSSLAAWLISLQI